MRKFILVLAVLTSFSVSLFGQNKVNEFIDLYNAGDYEQIQTLYADISNPTDDEIYMAALSYFCVTKYAKTAEILQNVFTKTTFSMFPSQTELYATSLMNLEKYNDAVKAYEVLEKNKKLTENTTIEYASVLYKVEQYKKSYEMTKKLTSVNGLFICANSAFNLKDYNEAIKKYDTLLKEKSLPEKVEEEARFFKSYSYKFLGDEAFAKNDKQKAIKNYEMYLQTASTETTRQNAVQTLASVYTDYKMYDKAISVYETYVNKQNNFAVECMYKIAEIYAKSGDSKKSAKTYYSLFEKFPSSKYAEDALFRSGEILYLVSDYKTASKYFEEYSSFYPSGKYADSVLYYVFDSYVQTGDKTKAVLNGKMFVQKYPDSTFTPTVKQTLKQFEKTETPETVELTEAEKIFNVANEFYDADRKSEAAEKYLLAAEYFRKENNDDKVALCLYTATECFVHLGKKGDAEETAKLLKQLYPASRYSDAVGNLLR